MKKLSQAEWERKYIVGEIEQFDQKNTLFNRPLWDDAISGEFDDWSITGRPTERPGFGRWEHALDRAGWSATQLTRFNFRKPNQSRAATALMQTMAQGRKYPPQPRDSIEADVGDPVANTRNIKKAARFFGADIVGVCEIDQRWLYSHSYEDLTFMPGDEKGESRPQHVDEAFCYAIVMGFEMDYRLMQHYPSYISAAATGRGYSRMVTASSSLSSLIGRLGYQAIDCGINDVALSVPLALLAGLGDLGRNGLLVTPELGPRLRLTPVLTSLPLLADKPIDFGVTEFCRACKKCADACPSQAIPYGDRTTEPHSVSNVAGELKWPVHAEKCRMHWTRLHNVCSACISSCPYNKPNTFFHRSVRRLADYARFADPLLVKADDLFGYGKPLKPLKFWEDWRPERG